MRGGQAGSTIRRVGIFYMAMYVPERELTNADPENVLDTTDKWIVEKLGIREWRIAADDANTSDLAVIGAKQA